ncbi:gliding motility lipoprotein GldH [Sphingobacterium griseoflavum]|uniref:Gliding motility lipoprotein GldH n=1 Tax=Sphingobacterium griseoflavum TaxID=1474952 RepID=A0ABQ3HVP8_9SPHI|nr:gliding motility lipoprotein GldH [Sphingobacterium griseoflavum]GHE29398.1 gliding motility lipoprotein GldH [Sphingobacterium griseoflavum]
MKDLSVRLLFLSILFLCDACNESAVFQRNESILNHSWSYSDIPRFDVHVTDASAHYDIWVNIRHDNDYRYANLFFLLHEKGPLLSDTSHRYEIKLAELDGRWTGKSAGSLYVNQLLVKDAYQFPDTGIYHFAIEQNMRENPLRNITDVGITVVKKP